MVKVALISDTHGDLPENALEILGQVDEIWHAGDIGSSEVLAKLPAGPMQRIVYGNIDDSELRIRYEEELLFETGGVKVMMLHIGGKPPRYAKGVKAKIKSLQPDLFVCGHSHICKVEFDKVLDCLYMNPGALGNQGFHQVKTLLTFELDGKIKNLNVVELGKRGKL
ncbi:metallophosphoesterase family protein [Cyclobacterium jeungdonense]|uniref:Phosphoesterase n=1 Tax=Cyclobacterium jeungdonense TaxID=708087 RepID=A0ABT8C858_9BACT|nr:metallophosphoesterase family protein [Cyclobacterium jeungdonense]MDN3688974.1 metallophosphoesterase family protein [Cyclobacterium jeungdonense]